MTAKTPLDEETFRRAEQLIRETEQPYLGLVFSITSHFPFKSPGTRWSKFDHANPRGRFLNVIQYTDWALGVFLDSMRDSKQLENTTVLIFGDHTFGGLPGDEKDTMRRAHGVPCLIIDPDLGAGRRSFVASQTDLMPTIVEHLGLEGRYACAGHSLLDDKLPPEARWTVCVDGSTIRFIGAEGWVSGREDQRLESSPSLSAELQKDYWRKLQAVVTEFTIRTRHNTVLVGDPR